MKGDLEKYAGTPIGQVPASVRRKIAALPMTPWERTDASTIPKSRGDLNPNEHWHHAVFINNRYIVQMSVIATKLEGEDVEILHLWIKCIADGMPRSWRDLQAIKDQLIGEERIAVEVFPPRSELVDNADLSHLWVYPRGFVLPFTLRSSGVAR